MNIYLVRHGQTIWNNEDRYHGTIDIELDEVGIKQAEAIAARLRHCSIRQIYSSNLRRALQTANAIQHHTGAELKIVPELQDINLGQWEGKRWKDIKVEYDGFLKDWFRDIVNIPAPDGESYKDLQDRATRSVMQIADSGLDNIAIVTHGAVIKTLVSTYLGVGLENRSRFEVSNASISMVQYNEGKKSFKVFCVNDVSHLKEWQ